MNHYRISALRSDISVRFDMRGQTMWPWETETLRAYSQGNQIRWTPSAPPGAPGSGGGFEESLTTKGCGTYYLESWSFRRANNGQPDNKSRISSDVVVQKGGSQRIRLCR